jgi:hypothetical protein
LLMPHDSRGISTTSALVRGSILLTLAAGFPVIGWFLITPLIIITSFGATVFALLRWMPREAAPFDHKVSSTKKLSMLSLAILWALPFVAISVLSIAFLLRGAYMLELAAGVPVIAWLIIIPVYVIVLLVASAYALARCCREKPHPIAGIQ